MTIDRRESPGGGHRDERRPTQDRDRIVISERQRRILNALAEAEERKQEYREDRSKFWWAVGTGVTIGLANSLPEWLGRLWHIIGDHVR